MRRSVHRVAQGVTLATVMTASVVAVGVASARADTLLTENFDAGAPAGWTTSGGSWSVVTDGSGVYRQASTGADAKAHVGDTAWTDYAVEARVKPLAFNGRDRSAGVVARAQSLTRFYQLGLSNAGQVQLSRRVGGSPQVLAATSAQVTPNAWHTLRLEVSGESLRGFLDGLPVVSATDGSLRSGRVGLFSRYAGASFDDVRVVDAAGPSPTVSPTATAPPSAPPTTSPPPPPPPGQPDGYASVPAFGMAGVTGGAGGPTVTVTTAAELAGYAGANSPYTILVAGRIQVSDMVTVVADKTIVGLGGTAEIVGGGLQLGTTTRPGHNVIIRNITFRDASDDSISVHNGSHHVWIDHNEFHPGFDGSVDIKRRSSHVTVSWNRFHATDKSMLLGHSDSFTDDIGYLKVTYHHNWFDGSHQRHPRVRFGDPVHVYNNYYRGVGLYGVASTENAGVLVEGNYFEDVAYPCYSASGYADSAPGRLAQRGNIFVRSGACETHGSVGEPGAYYSYTADDAQRVPQLVAAGAGVGRIGS